MEIKTLKEAKDLGLKFYFSGKPCKHGHISKRKVNDRSCMMCNTEKSRRHAGATKKWREDHLEQDKANKRKHYKDNRDDYLMRSKLQKIEDPEQQREWGNRYRNSEKGVQQGRDWTDANRDKHNDTVKAYKKRNPGKINANTNKRRAARIQRTPPWADFQAIAEIYEESALRTQETGIQHHVDHKIPLQGDIVSGLHIAENLEILESSDNLSKGNSFS